MRASAGTTWWRSQRAVRRVVVAVIGITLLVFGAVLFFTPGPGLLVVMLALAVLAAEFTWARRLLRRVEDASSKTIARFRGRRSRETGGKDGSDEGGRASAADMNAHRHSVGDARSG